jgi:methyl coenzyme M reductase subunit C
LALSVSNVNEQPVITTAPTPFAVNDNATILPFAALTVTDPDAQAMSAIISIKNGVARGDFTPATTFGWIRTVVGNDIRYSRSFPSVANIGATVQAAIRNFLFQSRANAIKPNTTETTVFAVTVTDGVASPVINSTTTVITTSVNDGPAISGASTSLSVNDNAVINPFSTLTVVDADHQEMLISVTILNGVNRGDFTNALSSGWTVRQVVGNNITYKRYFSPAPNVGSLAEAAFRALTFQPRSNALKPGVTELTDFQVTVSDGVAAPLMDRRTRVTTVSVNQAPTMSVTMANQNDYGPIVPFNTLTVTDPDTQNLFVRVTIINGLQRGDFPTATTRGWTRKVSSGNIVLERFFGAAPNNGALVQAALREMIFEPRTTIPAGVQETTNFTVSINDGLATATESATSVAGSSVASKPLLSALKKRALSRSLIESPSPRWQVS